jgi:hypothetical protein
VTGPEAEPSAVPTDVAAVRAELEDVRSQVVGLWNDGDAVTGREVAGSVGGGVAVAIALLLVGVVLTNLGKEPAGALAAAAVLAGLLLAVAALGLRAPVRRRVHLYREVRRLRRRERELIARLPAGTAGPGSYRRYYVERFSNPTMVLIHLGLLVVLLLTLLS